MRAAGQARRLARKAELAEWIGVHRNYISQLKRVEMSAQVGRMFDLLSLLGVDIVLAPRGGRWIDDTSPPLAVWLNDLHLAHLYDDGVRGPTSA